MIRHFVGLSVLVAAALCAAGPAARAQATIADAENHKNQPVQIIGNTVAVYYAGSTTNLLSQILVAAKKPYIMPRIEENQVTVQVQNLSLDEMLDLVCAAANPPLDVTKRSGVYVFTVAQPKAVPAPLPPQVTVNNLPREDNLAASLAVSGPGAVDTVLELRLLSLQAERRVLAVDYKSDFPRMRKIAAEIEEVQRMIALRRAQRVTTKKAMPTPGRKPVRTAQRP